METQIKQSAWGARSVSFWITFILASGIIFIGLRFIMLPHVGAAGYGINFKNASDTAYGQIKGIRDIFTGIALLPLLFMRMRRAVAWVFSAAVIVPVADFLIVLTNNGAGDMEHLLIHGITALVMIVNSILLFKQNHKKPSIC
ncbi:DUF4267 domain-containing protein [Mucilaginibacter roseus]|uniref:DUF4267 domain-containing protein n=1 Tax=Mucilaginibacter roseus TaxID=1528868 RepID=A0ABS8TYT9_9SPHI|nr:DUF4267 domain-containing protein [Mucilaginibacter roseus]MCD8739137.1 DUF4267 domain-containing protein [Mucilaginibacter roseus]